MTDFPFEFNQPARTGAFPTRELAASTEGEVRQVFVQLGESRTNANIKRNNYAIPSFELDQDVIDDIVIGPIIRNKVVSQSIAPGTVVAKGTTIDLVLAPASSLPGRIIPNGHIFLAEQTMEQAYDLYLRDDPVMRRLLERNPDPDNMSTTDRAIVEERAGQAELTEQPGRRPEDLVRSLHLARTMVE